MRRMLVGLLLGCAAAICLLAGSEAASAAGIVHNDFRICAVDPQANTVTACAGQRTATFVWQTTTVAHEIVNSMYVTETGFAAIALIHTGDLITGWYSSGPGGQTVFDRVDDHVAHTIPFAARTGTVCATSSRAGTITLCSRTVFTVRPGTTVHAIVNRRRVKRIGLSALTLIHKHDRITVSYTPLSGTPLNPLKQLTDLTAHTTKRARQH